MNEPFITHFGDANSATRVAAADTAFATLKEKVISDVRAALGAKKENPQSTPISAATELMLMHHATHYAELARAEPNRSDGTLKRSVLRNAERALMQIFSEYGLGAVGQAAIDDVDGNINDCKRPFSPHLAKRAAAERSR